MNYLAHLYLSANRPEIAIGNFIADHVKGSMVEKYDGGVRDGIRLHRLIDTFTDTHPVVEESKARLRPEFRKYAPVIVDIYYDHFLARDWEQYHHQPLTEFAEETYALLRKNESLLPERTLHMLSYMEPQNWLVKYATLDGMQRALTGLSRRATFESNMQHAHLFLDKHYAEFEREFNAFFPDLRMYVHTVADLMSDAQ
ncbi:MAG: ACP phosphodiesterase [Bacteroidia bacterium]